MEFEMNRKEILRYLGYGRQEADASVMALMEECAAELWKAATPRSFYRSFPLKVEEDGLIDGTVFQTRSQSLKRNLKDCTEVILFAATLGTGVEVLLHKYTKLQMSKAVVIQAAAAAMLEDYCDRENSVIRDSYEERMLYLRPRFSPGYGDFPLECQREITAALETGKRLGIMLTDGLLMTPSKSVTAVMGVSSRPYRCEIKGCEACGKADCAYRRG